MFLSMKVSYNFRNSLISFAAVPLSLMPPETHPLIVSFRLESTERTERAELFHPALEWLSLGDYFVPAFLLHAQTEGIFAHWLCVDSDECMMGVFGGIYGWDGYCKIVN